MGVEIGLIDQIAKQAGCGKGVLPFTYLGLPVGSNMSKIENLDDLVSKFQVRLSKWKANCLSVGGCLTLVVLGRLPIYLMSMFHAPKGVIKKLESLRSNFFGEVKRGS